MVSSAEGLRLPTEPAIELDGGKHYTKWVAREPAAVDAQPKIPVITRPVRSTVLFVGLESKYKSSSFGTDESNHYFSPIWNQYSCSPVF